MTFVSISEAAKLAGISRTHLYRKYISTGNISISTSQTGHKEIDTAEIIRIFGHLAGDVTEDTTTEKKHHDVIHEITALKERVKGLEDVIRIREQQLQEHNEREKTASNREAFLQGHIQELANGIKLLENKRLTEQKRSSFWDWFKSS